MLQLYDVNKNKIKGLAAYKDYCIESTLKTGDKVLSFLYPKRLGRLIKNEGYIRTKTDEFVIKSIDTQEDWITVNASLNVEDLEGEARESFTCLEETISKCLDLACAGTGWTASVTEVTKKRTVRMTNCNSWDIIQQARKTYLVEYKFDTINKIIYVKEKQGQDKGTYFTQDLNLKKLDINNDSYDFFTRIRPIGKDGLKINVNGKDYLENYQYSSKVKTLIWKDERYTVASNLVEDATIKLNELSKPRVAYAVDIIDLAKLNTKYKNILDYGIGDTIYLVSKENEVREKQRIVKIKEYTDEPERNSCEIANTIFTFEDIQKEYSDTTDTVNNITSDNGTVSEGAISKAVEHLTINKVDMNEFNALVGTVGSLTVNKLDVDVANIKFAEIDTAIAKKIEVTDLTAGNIEFEVASGGTLNLQTLLSKFITGENGQYLNLTGTNTIFANSIIKDAMIDTLSVNKILAGDISTNKFRIVSDSGKMLIADNTIQIKDSTRVRVQIGKDASNDYNMYVWDALGKLMFDATGLKADGIKTPIIRDDMVSSDADINGSKINISSLITEVNKEANTQTIKASKVALDTTGQTLEVSFNSLKSNVDSIEVGGRNLLIGKPNVSAEITTNSKSKFGIKFSIGDNGGTWRGWSSLSLKSNKDYIVSFVAWSTKQVDINCDLFPDELPEKIFTITTDVKKFTFNIRSASSKMSNCSLRFFKGGYTFTEDVYITDIKLEEGNKSTDWTPAIEDTDGKIQANTASINVALEGIGTLVKETKIEDNGTVVKLQDFYSTYKQTTKDITFKVEGLETIGIKGSNLLLNSGAELDLINWTKPESNGEVSVTTTDVYYGAKAFRIKQISNTTVYQTLRQNVKVTAGDKIAVSGFVKVLQVINTSSSVRLACNYYKADGTVAGGPTPISFNTVGNYRKVEYEITIPTDIVTLQIVLLVQGAEATFDNIKVEKGLSPTEWIPAQEDIDAQNATINTMLSQSKQNIRCNELGAKINYSAFATPNAGELYLHGFNTNNEPIDANGKIYWNSNSVTVPKGVIDVNADCIIGGDIFLFINVTNQTVIMGAWYDTTNKAWKYKFLIGGTSSGNLNPTNDHVALGVINMKDAETFNYAYLFESPQSLKALTVGNMDMLTRMNSTELKITDSAITASVSKALNDGTASITTTKFILDTTGLTVKNGAIKVQNNAGTNVLYADVNGNLRLNGRLDNISSSGRSVTINDGMVYAYTDNVLNFALGNNTLAIYDYFDTTKETKVGELTSSKNSLTGNLGIALLSDKDKEISIGYRETSSTYRTFIRFNKDMNYGVQYPINVLEDTYFWDGKSLGFGRNSEIGGTSHLKGSGGVLEINLPANTQGKGLWVKNSYTAQVYMIFQEGEAYKALIEPSCYVNGNFYANGKIACSGAKTRIVQTSNYNKLSLNAYETADCLFADYGSGIIGEDGTCYIVLDDKLLETINTNRNYQIFLTAIDKEDKFESIKLKVIKKEYNYFVVKGNVGLEFDWNIVAKQLGYEDDRLVDYERDILMETEDILKFDLLSNEETKDNVEKVENLLLMSEVI